jgi:hypothetical protein
MKTHKTCKACGLYGAIDLFAKNRNICIECFKLRQKHYREINSDEYRKYHIKYREENKDTLLLYNKSYYQENKEDIYTRNRKWAEAHKSEVSAYNQEYRLENKEKLAKQKAEYRFNHKEEITERDRLYRERNKEKLKEKHAAFYQANKTKFSHRAKKYYEENKEEINKRNYKKKANRLKIDPEFRLRECISSAIRNAILRFGSTKNGISFTKYLDYPISVLKKHLEDRFEDWMNWDNWGIYNINRWNDDDPSTWTWQIDHIIPQSDLPYKSMEDENFKICWALENLRPLSAKQNQLDGVTRVRHKKEGNENAEGTNNE